MRLRAIGFCAAALAAALLTSVAASAQTLDRLRQTKTIRIAFREDAPPFSYKGASGDPAGFMVDLCRAVAKDLAGQLNLPQLSVSYVPVTAANRFDAIASGKADLLCEPTTETLGRRELVDFSIPTFIDGAGLLIRSDGPKRLSALGGKKIGVLAGTTTQQELEASLKDAGISAEVIPAQSHRQGLEMLDQGKVSAYFADRGILMSLARESTAPQKLLLADNYLTIEPYALALPRGDEAFRLAVDRALSRIYRSGDIVTIFTGTFGAKTKPSDVLKTLYLIAALPD